VVAAVDGRGRAFTCAEIHPRDPPTTPAESCTAPRPIARAMPRTDTTWRESLPAIPIADLAQALLRKWLDPRLSRVVMI
jgi:DNA-binding IscR family transcriptional regulator